MGHFASFPTSSMSLLLPTLGCLFSCPGLSPRGIIFVSRSGLSPRPLRDYSFFSPPLFAKFRGGARTNHPPPLSFSDYCARSPQNKGLSFHFGWKTHILVLIPALSLLPVAAIRIQLSKEKKKGGGADWRTGRVVIATVVLSPRYIWSWEGGRQDKRKDWPREGRFSGGEDR